MSSEQQMDTDELNDAWIKRVNEIIAQDDEARRAAMEASEPVGAGLAEYLNEPASKAPEDVRVRNWERLDKNVPLGNYNRDDEIELIIGMDITDLWRMMGQAPRESTWEDEEQRQRTFWSTLANITRGRNGFERRMLMTRIGETMDSTPPPPSKPSNWKRVGL